MIGSDLFQVKNDHYLFTADCFSRYPEVIKLTSTTSAAVIVTLNRQFARFGIPEIVRSDNGPQYDSAEFADFAKQYGFTHQTSSPRFPQSNGFVERMVKTVKKLLQQSDDPCLALLTFHSTPLPWCNLNPTELLMGRRLRTRLPKIPQHLKPTWSYLSSRRRTRGLRRPRRGILTDTTMQKSYQTFLMVSVDYIRYYSCQRNSYLISV